MSKKTMKKLNELNDDLAPGKKPALSTQEEITQLRKGLEALNRIHATLDRADARRASEKKKNG